jgi:hypothetical protein
MHRILLSAAGAVLLVACDLFDPGGPCDMIVRPGIVAHITHAETTQPLADSATGVVIDGSYSDSLKARPFDGAGPVLAPGAVLRYAAYERAGTYTVFVTRPGFRNWSTGGVRVVAVESECNRVRTVTLEVALVPLP